MKAHTNGMKAHTNGTGAAAKKRSSPKQKLQAAERKKPIYGSNGSILGKGHTHKYSQEMIERICNELASGKLLPEVCAPSGMPSQQIVFEWLQDPRKPEFLEMYRQAKVLQAEAMACKILREAETPLIDVKKKIIKDAKGKIIRQEVIKGDNTARSALIISTSQWMLARLAPRKYGERMQIAAEVDDSLLKELAKAIAGSPGEEAIGGPVIDVEPDNGTPTSEIQ